MNNFIQKIYFPAIIIIICLICPSSSESINKNEIPKDLLKWESWVLYGMEERLCPSDYNDDDNIRCTWPSRLKLFVEPLKGRFEQQWLVYVKSWIPLPGDTDIWPSSVELNGKKIPVIKRSGIPFIHVSPGKHTVKGEFMWSRLPEMIKIPGATGLINLFINNNTVDSPIIDRSGRLWLQKQTMESKKEEDKIETSVFRLLDDKIPMEVTSYIQINISGRAREISLGDILLKNSIPMSLKSPLPSRIGPEGQLIVQTRPGRWKIQIVSRFEDHISKIGPVSVKYGAEIWSFKSQNHLRMVKIKGVQSIDPGQTNMPSGWKPYPAFIIKSGNELTFHETRRGNPDPAPDSLKIHKTWWLDFDGMGFTIQDKITGTMSRNWNLTMNPPCSLGRVSIEGRDRLITAHGKDKKPGIELRKGEINIVADSRYEKISGDLQAVGWDHDFQSTTGILNLPPGWRLLASSGIDSLPGTWFQKWTLLDFFLVLIISIAVFKTRSWKLGITSLITMILIYHEPGSPRIVFLHILASLTLFNVLPAGWFKKITASWCFFSIITLLVISIPFMVQQIRYGMYPQLEETISLGQNRYKSDKMQKESLIEEVKESLPRMSTAPMIDSDSDYSQTKTTKYKQRYLAYSPKKQAAFTYDPKALIQTGPGIPTWKWRSYEMKWNGPVAGNQKIRFWLLSPATNLFLGFLRTMLLAIFMYGLLSQLITKKMLKPVGTATMTLLFCLLLQPVNLQAENSVSSYPPLELLEELQQRLLEKPDCYPDCADILKMDLETKPENLRILLNIHAAIKTAIPLPVSSKSWLPQEIYLDNQPIKGISKDNTGTLWVLIPKGIHSVVLTGGTDNKNSISISLPLIPHHASFAGTGWKIDGIHEDGKTESGIQLNRIIKHNKKNNEIRESALPPFFHIKRVLNLGLEWQVLTTITRVTPPGTPLIVTIPLIDNESVTTPGIHVKNGIAHINMDHNGMSASWVSILKTGNEIKLNAPVSVPWTETWIIDASPIWHCEPSGLPVIHHQDKKGHWRPEWRPWPGEKITIKVTRPEAIPGEIITMNMANLVYTIGKRFNKAELNMKIRSSKGGQHEITLPEHSDLQVVKINNKSQPVRQENQIITLPLQPGNQNVFIKWHQPTKSLFMIRGPKIKIGNKTVNTKVTFKMPQDRWILGVKGPKLGPAVLFWSYLFVVIIAAIALGKTTITPLRTFQWLLLGLGLTQVDTFIAILIIGWLLALGFRKEHTPPDKWFHFNIIQLILAIWTIVAMIGLYQAIEKGLLGNPDMQIAGNHSTRYVLNWTQDRISSNMPQPYVFSLHHKIYQLLMLSWALWLAFSLLKWLRWGWESFSEGGFWRKLKRKKKNKLQDEQLQESTG
ncbi:MAG: hypothetical protein HN931_02045 [Desulfobacterales bacterium]|nr:hypothetical protein [Desulfobacterales bacterium]